MLTSYDVESRLKAIDNLDDAVAKLQPLAEKGQNDLLNNIERYIQNGEAPGHLPAISDNVSQPFIEQKFFGSFFQKRTPSLSGI